jgi:predicted RNA-binding Zn-ribbon protein involved in translation (DUF1610 family)
MANITYECEYCGNKWKKEDHYSNWLSSRDAEDKCPKCGDKNVKVNKHTNETKDAFGYNKK